MEAQICGISDALLVEKLHQAASAGVESLPRTHPVTETEKLRLFYEILISSVEFRSIIDAFCEQHDIPFET